MLSAKINGQWLSTIGAYSPITVEYGPHGSEAASWEMNADLRHTYLRGNVAVDIYDGGICIWSGTLIEPSSDGKYRAKGAWHDAEGLYPMDGSGNLTTNIDLALFHSIITRAELNWTQLASISNVEWASSATTDMTLADLFDRYAAENALRWWVTPQRAIAFGADPTTPLWLVPHAVAGRGLTPAEDEFYTHLRGRYLDAGGVYRTTEIGSADAAAVFGRRVQLIDLSELGNTTSTRANSVLTGMLLKSGARMGWGEGLELAHGQITTTGGTAAALNQITSLQMVRLAGTVDASRPYIFRGYTDIVLDTVRYTDGAQTISLTPMGYAPRTLGDALVEAADV